MIADAAATAPSIFLRLSIVSPLMFFSSSHRDCECQSNKGCNAGARWRASFERHLPVSSSAKADDPVRRGSSALSHLRGLLDARFRGHDRRFMRVKMYVA